MTAFGFLLACLILWVGIGALLLNLGGRPVKNKDKLVRSVDKFAVKSGETIKVNLTASPPVSFNGEDHDIIIAIDHSASMGSAPGSPLFEAREAAARLVGKFPDSFKTGVVAFDTLGSIICPLTGSSRKAKRALKSIASGGGTSVPAAFAAISEALDEARSDAKKVVILLTDGQDDHETSQNAKDALLAKHDDVLILCGGFGDGADMSLLKKLSGRDDRVFHVSSPEKIGLLFDVIGANLSGNPIKSVTFTERLGVDDAFLLLNVKDGGYARSEQELEWGSASLTPEALSVSYEVTARCAGWRPVAQAAEVIWNHTEGEPDEVVIGKGPRVLVLPVWAYWARLLINPLASLILNRMSCSSLGEAEVAEKPPLNTPIALDPLPAAEPLPELLVPRPAMLIGFGAAGYDVAQRVKASMLDRQIGEDLIWVGAMTCGDAGSVSDEVNPLDWRHNLTLTNKPSVISNSMEERQWLPQSDWLARQSRLHTFRGVGEDRALARLAGLQQLDQLREGLQEKAKSVKSGGGHVILFGLADDACFSGLYFDVAYLLAQEGLSVRMMVGASNRLNHERKGIAAFSDELTRLLGLRGAQVVPDPAHVGEVPTRIFDDLIVVGDKTLPANQCKDDMTDAIWAVTAYDTLREKIPPLTRATGAVQLKVTSRRLPQFGLVRTATERLMYEFFGGWLGVKTDNEKASKLAEDLFWESKGDLLALAPRSFSVIAKSLSKANMSDINMESLSDDQYVWRALEAKKSSEYVERWAKNLLFPKPNMPAVNPDSVINALDRIILDLTSASDTYRVSHGDQDQNDVYEILGGTADELRYVCMRVRDGFLQWRISLFGNMIDGESPSDGLMRKFSRSPEMFLNHLTPFDASVKTSAERQYQDWKQRHLDDLAARVYFDVSLTAKRASIFLKGLGSDIEAPRDIEDSLLDWFDAYGGEITHWTKKWPVEAIRGNDLNDIYIGNDALVSIPPGVDFVSRDPAYGAIVSFMPNTVEKVLDHRVEFDPNLPYILSSERMCRVLEEATMKAYQRERVTFPPAAALIMDDPMRALKAARALADGSFTVKAGQIHFRNRDIGPELLDGEGQEAIASARFARLLMREVNQDVTDLTGPKLVQKMKQQDVLKAFSKLAIWDQWSDTILGLCLLKSEDIQ